MSTQHVPSLALLQDRPYRARNINGKERASYRKRENSFNFSDLLFKQELSH